VREGISLPSFDKLWRPLTKEQMEIIETSSYRFLSEIGMFIEDKEMIKYAVDAGAELDPAENVVKFPEYVIKERIAKAPKNFTFAARDPKNDIEFKGPSGKCYIISGEACPKIQEWDETQKDYTIRMALLMMFFTATNAWMPWTMWTIASFQPLST